MPATFLALFWIHKEHVLYTIVIAVWPVSTGSKSWRSLKFKHPVAAQPSQDCGQECHQDWRNPSPVVTQLGAPVVFRRMPSVKLKAADFSSSSNWSFLSASRIVVLGLVLPCLEYGKVSIALWVSIFTLNSDDMKWPSPTHQESSFEKRGDKVRDCTNRK